MSDSTATESGDDPPPVDGESTESSLLASAESGVGSMFAAFERGVLSLGDAEPAPAKSPKPGRTYDEVLAPIRWRRVFWALVASIVLLGVYFLATLVQVWMAADNDETREVDAIVVLGAAQFDGTPSPVFAARLDRALELWSNGLAPRIVTTGSKQEGDRFTEGFSGYVYLLERGVPDEALIPIVDGGDTWQQLSATANQFDQRELVSALLVSDRYHSFRLLAIADEVGIEAYVAPTDIDPEFRDYVREATAVSIGRIFGYRRLSAFNPETP